MLIKHDMHSCFDCLLLLLRNVEIDIMANAQYTYVGENGNASVTVSAKQGDLNQRTQDFFELCSI